MHVDMLTPISACVFQDRGIGNATLSTFGVAQAVLQIVLMLYPFSDPHPLSLSFFWPK